MSTDNYWSHLLNLSLPLVEKSEVDYMQHY